MYPVPHVNQRARSSSFLHSNKEFDFELLPRIRHEGCTEYLLISGESIMPCLVQTIMNLSNSSFSSKTVVIFSMRPRAYRGVTLT